MVQIVVPPLIQIVSCAHRARRNAALRMPIPMPPKRSVPCTRMITAPRPCPASPGLTAGSWTLVPDHTPFPCHDPAACHLVTKILDPRTNGADLWRQSDDLLHSGHSVEKTTVDQNIAKNHHSIAQNADNRQTDRQRDMRVHHTRPPLAHFSDSPPFCWDRARALRPGEVRNLTPSLSGDRTRGCPAREEQRDGGCIIAAERVLPNRNASVCTPPRTWDMVHLQTCVGNTPTFSHHNAYGRACAATTNAPPQTDDSKPHTQHHRGLCKPGGSRSTAKGQR